MGKGVPKTSKMPAERTQLVSQGSHRMRNSLARRRQALLSSVRALPMALIGGAIALPALGLISPAQAQQAAPAVPADAAYKQSGLPVEARVRDLLSRMTVEEKARQLDMYRGYTVAMRQGLKKGEDPAPKGMKALTLET